MGAHGLQFAGVVAALALGACGDESGVASEKSSKDAGTAAAGGANSGGGSGGATGGFPSSGGSSGGAATGGSAGSAGSAGASGGSGGIAGAAGSANCGLGGSGLPACGTGGPCSFPQGVPDADYIASACTYQDTDKSVDDAVNAAMAKLSGCSVGSDCPLGQPGDNTHILCQGWFVAVAQELRAQGFCAGQHVLDYTDEIAVSNTCCEGKWYGYHICNYGGGKVVWNPGARRGWWVITPSYCQ